jgi:hypothetical protein
MREFPGLLPALESYNLSRSSYSSLKFSLYWQFYLKAQFIYVPAFLYVLDYCLKSYTHL